MFPQWSGLTACRRVRETDVWPSCRPYDADAQEAPCSNPLRFYGPRVHPKILSGVGISASDREQSSGPLQDPHFASLLTSWHHMTGGSGHVAFQARRDPRRRGEWFFSQDSEISFGHTFLSRQSVSGQHLDSLSSGSGGAASPEVSPDAFVRGGLGHACCTRLCSVCADHRKHPRHVGRVQQIDHATHRLDGAQLPSSAPRLMFGSRGSDGRQPSVGSEPVLEGPSGRDPSQPGCS